MAPRVSRQVRTGPARLLRCAGWLALAWVLASSAGGGVRVEPGDAAAGGARASDQGLSSAALPR